MKIINYFCKQNLTQLHKNQSKCYICPYSNPRSTKFIKAIAYEED